MGRKSSKLPEPVEQPPKPVELEPEEEFPSYDLGEKAPKLAHLCRAALNRYGADVSVSVVRKFLAEEHPGYKYNEETLSATLSNQRKKFKHEFGDDSEPTAQDLMKVAQLVAEKPNFPEELDEMQQIIDNYGGLRRLRRCLRALEELGGMMKSRRG